MTKARTMKTRKNHGKMGMHHEYCDYSTYHGLHKWFSHLFEELGWMILAKKYGLNDKTTVYKASLHRFKHTVEAKMRDIHDKDKKEDLRIMHKNMLVLMEHAEKDL